MPQMSDQSVHKLKEVRLSNYVQNAQQTSKIPSNVVSVEKDFR